MRTCAICRQVRPKRSMTRVVRGPDGTTRIVYRDEPVERPRLRLVVPERPERLHDGHDLDPTIRVRT